MQGLVTPSLVPGLLTQSAEGQVVGRRAMEAGPSVWGHLTGSVWRGVGVCTVLYGDYLADISTGMY